MFEQKKVFYFQYIEENLYVSKGIKTNSKKLLDDIYDLMEKSWSPILKSKSFLDGVVLDIKDDINELE